MSELYAIVRWTASKVTSMGIIAEDECVKGKFEVGASIEAIYRTDQYSAKILFIGVLDAMTAKLDTLRTTYKSSSDSPKGRGHRVAKKKVMEDFVDVVPKSPAKTATNNAKKASKEQNALKRKAVDSSGDQIIHQLINQHPDLEVENSLSVEDFEIEYIDDDVSSLRTQLTEAKGEVARLQKTILQLTEANLVLQSKLPRFLEVRGLLQEGGTKPAVVPRFSQRMQPSKMYPQPSPKRTCNGPPPSVSPPPAKKVTSSSQPDPVEAVNNNFYLTEDIISKAGAAASYSALTCNLMGAIFSRELMAKSCLKAMKGETEKTVLTPEKIDAIVEYVMGKHSGIPRNIIRNVISRKLRDERLAFERQPPVKQAVEAVTESGKQNEDLETAVQE